ncbi:MAG: hypothetical protein ACXVAX_05130 [Pseudobdellovibrio sp.]
MKTTVTTAFLTGLLITSSAWAHNFHSGTYAGEGLWNSSQSSGVYKVETVVKGNEISSQYAMGEAGAKKWSFVMKNKSHNFFDVISAGEKIGTGYCLEKATVCHYEIAQGDFKLEETIVQQKNEIYKFGSKQTGANVISWQEKLSPVGQQQ